MLLGTLNSTKHTPAGTTEHCVGVNMESLLHTYFYFGLMFDFLSNILSSFSVIITLKERERTWDWIWGKRRKTKRSRQNWVVESVVQENEERRRWNQCLEKRRCSKKRKRSRREDGKEHDWIEFFLFFIIFLSLYNIFYIILTILLPRRHKLTKQAFSFAYVIISMAEEV